ncbi:MAG: hypothetical protein IH919_01385 [Deltaproteobacteria bacterium]|nr:hypothetical protein [Deltaproteobacteria bacterium]
MQDVIEENAGGPVVELTQGLDTIDGNPHLWLDVSKARRYVERIRADFPILATEVNLVQNESPVVH